MTTSKKILLGIGAIVALSLVYGYNKVQELQSIFDKMTIEPYKFKNVKVDFTKLTIVMDFLLINPSNLDFAVSGYVATLTKVKVYFKNVFIGIANINMDEVSVPAQGQIIIHDINIVLPIKNLVQNGENLLDFDEKYLTFVGVIEVAGNEFEIGQ